MPTTRTCLVLSACLMRCLGHAQQAAFEQVIDPPGDNAYHTLADGLVAADGHIYLLGGFQNVQEPAFNLTKYAPDGQFLWARKVEYNGAAQLAPQKVVQAAGGDLFAFGTLYTSTNDYFITRIDPAGEVQWTRTYRQEQPGNDYGFSSIVATTNDELVVSMGLIDRTVALRLDLDGTVLWSHIYRSDGEPTEKNPGFDFAATSDGGVLLTEKAYEDIFLVRLDSLGVVDWAKRYPDNGYCQTHIARELSDGDFVIAGSREAHPFAARISGSGQIIWMKEYAFDEGYVDLFDHAIELSDGDILLTPSWNASGMMALRITPLGAPVWARTIAGGGYTSVIGDPDGDVVLAGRTLLELDGGFEEAMLLLRTDESLGLGCFQGTTGASATDVVTAPPALGSEVVDEAIIAGAVDMLVSTPLFGTRLLCAPDLLQERGPAVLEVFPNVVPQGADILIRSTGHTRPRQVTRIAPDGMSTSLTARWRGDLLCISTAHWAAGMYVISTGPEDGAPMRAARVIVQ